MQLAWRHGGSDPFKLYHMDRPEGSASGTPANLKRYKHFLYACAIVAQEDQIKESAGAFGGTTDPATPKASKRKRRRE